MMNNAEDEHRSLQVFLSYSHRDDTLGLLTTLVQTAIDQYNADAAESNSLTFDLFIDNTGISSGDHWDQVIDQELDVTDIFLPCITLSYCLSENCAKEFTYFQQVRHQDEGAHCCIPLFLQDIPQEFASLATFNGEVFTEAKAINGVEVSALLNQRAIGRDELEKLIVSKLVYALDQAVQNLSAQKVAPSDGDSGDERSPEQWKEDMFIERRGDMLVEQKGDVAIDLTTSVGMKSSVANVHSIVTMNKPAPCVIFNAVIDDSSGVEERGFALIRDVTERGEAGCVANAGEYGKVCTAFKDHVYMVKAFVRNNIAANRGLTMRNVRITTAWNAKATAGLKSQVRAQSDNFDKNGKGEEGLSGGVWDEACLMAEDGYQLQTSFVPGSARYFSNAGPEEGIELSNDITGASGTPLHYEQMNDEIPKSTEYSGYVSFLVRVVDIAPAFSCVAWVRHAGEKKWHHVVNAQPGDRLQLRLDYHNTGTIVQKDVIAREYLPKELVYQRQTTRQCTCNHLDGYLINDDRWIEKGLNLGSYLPDGNTTLLFDVVVVDGIEGDDKGNHNIDTVGLLITAGRTKMASRMISVSCKPKPEA
ncbi:toll/interleukin-1 receptor domain-containing protein [Bifidobacterium sp. ESL0728]|uniref:toll/interleukin-1 receptor domain-containing protein n=1 Tax=Bifidobacterium sp. ESL0728 TaxID=2983220 RepID=UPI0023F9FC3B|nr:toll/interleukin-1 receptor domain-containing protein [Bifidobacterium sp. ESL0728]WEV59383.1 toll/interleukin-1 receptor domain-containing protein [Bifidobacterium sp. ESL0728]